MNQDDFQSIVEQHTDLVYNVAYRMMNNAQDAEDITQETFLSACKQSATSGHFLIEEIRAVMLPVSWPLGRPDCTIFFARKSPSVPPYDVPI